MSALRVCIFAGGTGGHVFPALAVAERLREEGWSVIWVGTRRGIESRVVPGARIPFHIISTRPVRGARRPGAFLAMALGLVQAVAILLRIRPAVVLGMGGFVSAAGGVAAWLLRRPLLIHEQNAIPGLANRALSRLATGIMESFPDTFPPRGSGWLRTTGNPVRAAVAGLPPPAERFSTRDRGAAAPLRVLVIGGSQGAEVLNRSVPAAVAGLGRSFDIRHQAGEGRVDATRARYRGAPSAVAVTAFVDDMAGAYGWADLAVCRAGAGTVAELAAVGLGAILVPYPSAADDHQNANARYLERCGAARVVPEDRDIAPRLASHLDELASDRSRCLAMAEAAWRSGERDATERVVSCCRERGRPPVFAGPVGEGT